MRHPTGSGAARFGFAGGAGGADRLLAFAQPRPGHDRLLVTVTARADAATLHDWDRLVAATPGSDVSQLSGWANVRRDAGFGAVYVFAHARDVLVGGALVLQRRLPGVGVVGYLPYGPVLSADFPATRAESVDAVCAALTDLARRRFAALFVQPNGGDHDVSDAFLRHGFRQSTAGIAPAASLAVDLSRPTDDLRASMSSGTRAGVRRAATLGVCMRDAGEADLPAVAELLAETAEHHRFSAHSSSYLRTLHRQLAPEGHLRVLVAELDGDLLATDVLTSSGGTAKLRLTGMRRSDDARRSGAATYLHWEAILWAKANGYRGFDLGGIPSTAVDPIRAGRRDLAARVGGRVYYKASFGARPFHYPPAVELFPSRLARLGYDAARRTALGGRLLAAARTVLRGTSRGV